MQSRWFWAALAVAFGALNVFAFTQDGLDRLVLFLTTLGPWHIVVMADLLLALLVGLTLLWKDAGSRGLDPRPYVVLTLLTGSIGLLLYMARTARAAELRWDKAQPRAAVEDASHS
jgi:hypothetical protein